MASSIISANWLSSDLAVILVMSFAFFGQGMVGLGWTLISDIAPKGLGGLTGGLFNFCAKLRGDPHAVGDWLYRRRLRPTSSMRLSISAAPRCSASWRICLFWAMSTHRAIAVKELGMIISGNTQLIAHLGYPTGGFKAPMIYNPWFDRQQVDVKVVPTGVKPEALATVVPALFTLTNIIVRWSRCRTKIATCGLVHRLSPTAAIARPPANAIRREADGTLSGDMFDGDGFVLGIRRKGFQPEGARALVVGWRRRGIGNRRFAGSGGGARSDALR